LLANEEAILQQTKMVQGLSEPIRLKALMLLQELPLCPCVLSNVLGLPRPKLSYHLSILKRTGLAKAQEKGRWQVYSLTKRGRRTLKILGCLKSSQG